MTPEPSLRDELREKTGPLHQKAEAALDLLNPSMTLGRYQNRLKVLHSFYAQLEPPIVAHPGWAALGLDMAARRKLHLLEADLASLGAVVERTPPGSSSLPFPAAVGMAYVVEGATLGGAILHRHLSAAFGFNEGPGARFFHAYGEQTGPRWKEFVAALARTSFDSADRQRATEGAVSAFALLLRLARPAD